MVLKIWSISQNVNNSYDTYDNAVVCAETEDDAKRINPSGEWDDWNMSWCDIKDVKVELIGIAIEGSKKGIICASFNAG